MLFDNLQEHAFKIWWIWSKDPTSLTKKFKKKPCTGYSSKNSFTFWQNFEPKKCCARLVHLTSCWLMRSMSKVAVTYGQQCHYHIISYALLKPTIFFGIIRCSHCCTDGWLPPNSYSNTGKHIFMILHKRWWPRWTCIV